MNASFIVAWVAAVVAADPQVETKFARVAPSLQESPEIERSEDETRAVVLLHGFFPHPVSSRHVARAVRHDWQQPGCKLVRALAADADVYAFAYGQNAAVEEIAATSLGEPIALLGRLGYREIVLVGHSAGGLIAREFVEDHPDAGVTKVIQVCSPNGGAGFSMAKFGVRKSQEAFLSSLSKEHREKLRTDRTDRKIPAGVEFVCVVGEMGVKIDKEKLVTLGSSVTQVSFNVDASLPGDGVVWCDCQWSEDLQSQCIPAVPLHTSHFTAMRSTAVAEQLAELVRDPQPRWTAEQVAAARETILRSTSKSDDDR